MGSDHDRVAEDIAGAACSLQPRIHQRHAGRRDRRCSPQIPATRCRGSGPEDPRIRRDHPGPDDFLFPGLNSRGARPRSAELIRYDLAAVGLLIDLEGQPIEFKATRSSFSSWLDAADVPRERIKRLPDHAAREVTEAHYTKRALEQLMAAVLTIPLVWTIGVDTRPVAMTGGTSSEVAPAESLAPPARIGLATFGLGKDGSPTSGAPSQPCEKQQKARSFRMLLRHGRGRREGPRRDTTGRQNPPAGVTAG